MLCHVGCFLTIRPEQTTPSLVEDALLQARLGCLVLLKRKSPQPSLIVRYIDGAIHRRSVHTSTLHTYINRAQTRHTSTI